MTRKSFIILGPKDKIPFIQSRTSQNPNLTENPDAAEFQDQKSADLNASFYPSTSTKHAYNLISPSSIPNPSPSVLKSSNLLQDGGLYGSYPTSYPYLTQHTVHQKSNQASSLNPKDQDKIIQAKNSTETLENESVILQTDFEDHFHTKIIPSSKSEKKIVNSHVDAEAKSIEVPNYKISSILNKSNDNNVKSINKLDYNPKGDSANGPKITEDESSNNEALNRNSDSPQFIITNPYPVNLDKGSKSLEINSQGSKFIQKQPNLETQSSDKQKNEPKFKWSIQDITKDMNAQSQTSTGPRFYRPISMSQVEQTNQDKAETSPNFLYLKSGEFDPKTVAQNPSSNLKNASSTHPKKTERLVVADKIQDNKVVSLKRLHQDNGDENDFENLITENQIYGNKIVVKEKQRNILNDTSNQVPANEKSLVIQPNILYITNSQIQTNPSKPLIITQNNQQLFNKTDDKPNAERKQNVLFQVNVQDEGNVTSQTFKTVNPLTQSLSFVKTNIIDSKPTNVLQNLLNKPNLKIAQHYTTKNFLQQNQVIYQVPLIIDKQLKPANPNSELTLLLSNPPSKTYNHKLNKNINIISDIVLVDDQHKIRIPLKEEEVLSSLDMAERRLKKRRERRQQLKQNEKKPPSVVAKNDDSQEFKLSYKQYQMYVGIVGEQYFEDSTEEEESDSESEEEDDSIMLEEIKKLTQDTQIALDTSENKLDFMKSFGLTTLSDKKDKELENLERSVKYDVITSAVVSLSNPEMPCADPFTLPLPNVGKAPLVIDDIAMHRKSMFLKELRLGNVSTNYRTEYEDMWNTVLKERIKRNGPTSLLCYLEKLGEIQHNINMWNNDGIIDIHTKDQLEIMTEIKKSVSENNNLIKKALDDSHQCSGKGEECTISALAEKNFTEISKLSNMADTSLKMFARPTAVDSCVLPTVDKVTPPEKPDDKSSQEAESTNTNVETVTANLVIPNVPKIISLKTVQDSNVMDTSPATSMDEPINSAAGLNSEEKPETVKITYAPPSNVISNIDNDVFKKYKRVESLAAYYKWPGTRHIIVSYKRYKDERKKEIVQLTDENEKLQKKINTMQAEVTNLSDELRQILNKQQSTEEQRKLLQLSLDKIIDCIKDIEI